MTWHKVEMTLQAGVPGSGVNLHAACRARIWCENNLSSNGVLWKHAFGPDFKTFYFAQPQDVIMFKLLFA